jgi:hypothetical protein
MMRCAWARSQRSLSINSVVQRSSQFSNAIGPF